jgi:hypothetical protein
MYRTSFAHILKFFKIVIPRFLDRRATARDMNGAKTLGGGLPAHTAAAGGTLGGGGGGDKEDKVVKRCCLIRTCNRPVTASVSKKWLIRLKKRLMKKVTLDWDKVGKASVKATFLVCAKHSSMVGKCLLPVLCPASRLEILE